jgi:shikimate dehydrogenase
MTLLRGSVLGSPIQHSLSPLLHREAFAFLGIEGSYDRVEVEAGALATFFATHSQEYDYHSLTMPLKEEALQLEIELDSVVSRIQSANTLYRSAQGWKLTSTDGEGFINALKEREFVHFNSVLVLGAGGTARAIVGALDGVSDSITVLGRTSTRREVLEQSVSQSEFHYERWSETPDFSAFDLVVNTTPAGAADLLADSLSRNVSATFFDVIYKPWPTVLASRWKDSGGEVISGIEMLLHQGIAQLRLASGVDIDALALATHLRPILTKAAK